MTVLLEAWLRVTLNSRVAPSASCTVASLTEMAGGPATISDVEWESFLSSLVQIASSSEQLVVSGRVMVIASLPVGSTSTFQPWLLPWVIRLALAMVAPVTVRAWFWIRA